MWWEVVFPSLPPFFILSELLIGFGIVRFVGVLLEPLCGRSFVCRVSAASYLLWEWHQETQREQNSLPVCGRKTDFKSRSRTACVVYQFFKPALYFRRCCRRFLSKRVIGHFIGFCTLFGNLAVGLTMRSYGRKEEQRSQKEENDTFSFDQRCFTRSSHCQTCGKRPLGKILGDAVTSSVQTLLMVGGFIILFSVFNRLLSVIQLTDILSVFTKGALTLFQLPAQLDIPFIRDV